MKSFVLMLALLGATELASATAHKSSISPAGITCAWSYREQVKDLARGIHRLRHQGNYDDDERSYEADVANQTTAPYDKPKEMADKAEPHDNDVDPIKVIAKRTWQWLHGHQDDRDNSRIQKYIPVDDKDDVIVKVILPAAKETPDNHDSDSPSALRRLRHYVFGALGEEDPSDDPLPRDHGSEEESDNQDLEKKGGLSNKAQEWLQAQLVQWIGCECQCVL